MFGNRAIAAVLAFFFGSLGIHKFYTGRIVPGVITLVITVVVGFLTLGAAAGLMGLIGIIEAIIYILKSDAEFKAAYVDGNKGWF